MKMSTDILITPKGMYIVDKGKVTKILPKNIKVEIEDSCYLVDIDVLIGAYIEKYGEDK